ncbi:MAG: prepilin-type N-terminal cleavage/methylation domain-containing protein [Spartobacteria bacterium]|nr:prepilin-type N-terminal cleavage/methylation domain-containing protein [Spartobacteria bacterium]
MKEQQKSSRKLGFTLAEVLIASLVVVMAVGGAYGALIMSRMMTMLARQHQEGEQLAMDQLWKTYHLPYEQLQSFAPNPQVLSVPEGTLLSEAGGTIRTGVMQYSNRCEIVVRVDWTRIGPINTGTNTPHEMLTIERYRTDL